MASQFEERRYNSGEILARRSYQGGGDIVKVEDFVKTLGEMSEGLIQPVISFEYDPPDYSGFADFIIEVSGKEE